MKKITANTTFGQTFRSELAAMNLKRKWSLGFQELGKSDKKFNINFHFLLTFPITIEILCKAYGSSHCKMTLLF